jgi:hypothetical protein
MEPPVPIGNRSQASILISVSGSSGWAGADVLLLQGGDEVPIGVATESLPFGVLAAALGQGPDTIWDRQNELIIDIAGQDRPFLSRSSSDVLDGGGLLIIGDELLQYCDAEVLATGLVRLRGLLRGRFGTSFKGSPAGTMVMSVPRAGGVWFDIDATMAGRELMFLVGGRGDPRGGVPVPHLVGGAGLAPLAPVHLAGERRPDGTIECSWVERDRAHWAWESGPASMPGRRYAWHFRGNDGSTARFETSATGVRLESAAQQAAFGTALPAGEFQIEALGDGPESLRLSRWVAI